MKILRLLALALLLVGCGDDDGGSADAPTGTPDSSGGTADARPADAGGGIDAATTDAAPACILPVEPINCTVGTDTPCTTECAGAYCYQFGTNEPICTNACGGAGDCPSGWSCNAQGRCRNP